MKPFTNTSIRIRNQDKHLRYQKDYLKRHLQSNDRLTVVILVNIIENVTNSLNMTFDNGKEFAKHESMANKSIGDS